MVQLAFNPAFAFALGIAVALIVLLVLEIYNSKRINKISSPIYEYAVKSAEEESNRILADARKEARRLLSEAESASTAIVATRKTDEVAAEKAYEATLHEVLTKLENRLAESVRVSEEMKQRVDNMIASQLEDGGKAARTRLDAALATVETGYAKQLQDQMQNIFADAKKHAEEYERARKQVVDERILSLVSETVKIVLGQSLPAEVHASLARSALEEAKQRGVF